MKETAFLSLLVVTNWALLVVIARRNVARARNLTALVRFGQLHVR